MSEWGPAMAGLTDLQRRYVLAMQFEPMGNATQWARMAGYEDNGKTGIRVTAHRLAHDPAITAAIQECAQATLHHVGPMLGVAVMLKIARDSKHPKQLLAAIALANRSGFHETTEHVMHVQHSGMTGEAMIARITELAGELGMDAARLLGRNAAGKPMKVIEHEDVQGSDTSGRTAADRGFGKDADDAGRSDGGAEADIKSKSGDCGSSGE